MLALANGMWVGQIPFDLEILTLPERILISRYFPSAFIVKLYPKNTGSYLGNDSSLNKGLRGNVCSYPLPSNQVASIIEGDIMPQKAEVLEETIAVTFVGPNRAPKKMFPDNLRIRRVRVRNALQWLKKNNPLYENINISEERLQALPENDIPEQIWMNMRHSFRMDILHAEKEGYVPEDNEEDGCADGK